MTEETAAGGATPAADATPAPAAVEAIPAPETAAETPASPETPAEGESPEPTDADRAASEAAKVLADRKAAKRQESRERWNAREKLLAETRQQLSAREAELIALRAKLKEPNPAEFDDVTKLTAAQVEHNFDKREAERLERQTAAEKAREERESAALFRDRESQFAEEVPDYASVAHRAPIDDETAGLIVRMEEGPALAYHLGKNPSEARRLSALSERDKAIELGRLAGRLSQAPPRKVTTAPTPVSAISGKGAASSTQDPAKMSEHEYVRWRKAGGGERRG